MARTRYDLTREELAALPALAGQPAYRARQVWEGLYRHLCEPEDADVAAGCVTGRAGRHS